MPETSFRCKNSEVTSMCRQMGECGSSETPSSSPSVISACMAFSMGKVSTVIYCERLWKAVGRSCLWLRSLCFPSWSWWIVGGMHCDRAHCPKAKALSFLLASACISRICKKRNCGAQWTASCSDGGLCSHLSATYGSLMEKHTMAHWNISSFQLSCRKKTPQYKQHCVPWQKMKGVSLGSEEAHKAGVSIARYNRQRSISSLFRHLKSLMQIGNHHSQCFHTEGTGAPFLPMWFYLSNKMIYFSKGVKRKGL